MAKHRRRHHRHHRHHRNPAVASISRPLDVLKSGFNISTLKTGIAVLAGNIITKLVAKQVTSRISALSNPFATAATTLLMSGVVASLTRKVMPHRANEVLLGGMLAGVAQGLTAAVPQYFPSSGLNDVPTDNGLTFNLNDYRDPYGRLNDYGGVYQASHPQLAGMQDYADPGRVQSSFLAGDDDV